MAIRKREFWTDLVERAAWTAAQAAIGVGVTTLNDIDHVWAIPIATALAALKAEVKRLADERGVSLRRNKTKVTDTGSDELQG